MRTTFRALSSPDYRLYFLGLLVSNIGTWMSRVAQDWLVLVDLTHHSAAALGIVTGLQFLPALLLAPWAGVIADRYDKRRIIRATQSLLLVSSLLLAVLVLSGAVQLWHVMVLATVQGVGAAIDAPARTTFISEIVGPDLLANAIALNSAGFNAARLIGPGVAGLIIAAVGTGWVFLINAASFLTVLAALARMTGRPAGAETAGTETAGTDDRATWHEGASSGVPDAVRRPALEASPAAPGTRAARPGGIREGLAYVRRRPDLVLVMTLVFVLGTFGLNFQMTTALMATEVYAKGATEYGLLGSIMAAGSLTAALLTARREEPRLAVILIALGGFAVASALAALAPTYESFALLLVPVGLSALTVLPTANSLIQISVDPAVRGRVMALYLAIFFGGTPIGAPLLGWVGTHWGARWTILVGSIATAVACIGGTIYAMRSGQLRASVGRGRPGAMLRAAEGTR